MLFLSRSFLITIILIEIIVALSTEKRLNFQLDKKNEIYNDLGKKAKKASNFFKVA